MISLLIKKFVNNRDNTDSPEVRRKYGEVCGFSGIAFNLILFVTKLIIGFISASIAITADAFNNLSDAGGSIITLLGFKLSGKKPDSGHPFGHGRIEYVSALLVAVAILAMSIELIMTSIEKIIDAAPIEATPITLVILSLSIIVKIYMAVYNKKYGKLIDSEAMIATSDDSRNDAIATGSVLLSTALAMVFTDLRIDGWCGLLVGIFVLISGIKTALNTISTLIGKPPSKELVDSIEKTVLSYDGILGVHDIVVHDYGPGRMMVSLHAEVPASGELLKLHALIERIELKIEDRFNCKAIIHMDPVKEDDELTRSMRRIVTGILYSIDPKLNMHDFRVGDDENRIGMSFDVLVPFDFQLSDEDIVSRITEAVRIIHDCDIVINVDRG